MNCDRIIAVLLCLALALFVLPTSAQARAPRRRVSTVKSARCGWVVGAVAVLASGLALAGPVGLVVVIVVLLSWRWRQIRRAKGDSPDPLAIAASWDALAACLRGGLDLPSAMSAIAPQLPECMGQAIRRTGQLLALGASPRQAWQPALAQPDTAELARAAMRTANSGAEFAVLAVELAERMREKADDAATAAAARTSVSVTGPLGLCILPAFLCLGIVPVVFGLASEVLAGW